MYIGLIYMFYLAPGYVLLLDAFLLLKVLPERRQFLLVPLMPPIFLGVHTAGSFFAYLTVGTTTDSTATFLGTLTTDALCCVFFWLYSLVVCPPAAPEAVAPEALPVTSLAGTGS
jgi:hypothetical protein